MFDKTFCTNSKCKLKAKCDRSYDRITELRKSKSKVWIKPYLSVSKFKAKDCQYFIEKSN